MDDTFQKKTIEQKIPQPVSTVRKEGQPVISHEPFVVASEEEPKLHPEVSDAGVEAVTQTPELPRDVQSLGLLTHSPESTKPITEPTGAVRLPLTQDQVEEVISSQKHDSAIAEHTEGIYRTNSIYGLAVLVKKIISKMHEKLMGNK